MTNIFQNVKTSGIFQWLQIIVGITPPNLSITIQPQLDLTRGPEQYSKNINVHYTREQREHKDR